MPQMIKIKKILISLLILAFIIASYFSLTFYRKAEMADNLIAVSWGDGAYGKAFYGAYVFLVPTDSGFDVQAEIKIGRGTPMIQQTHEMGVIGHSDTAEEASEKWGNIVWTENALKIGDINNGGLVIKREVFEQHR
jgi:hypothetical protein